MNASRTTTSFADGTNEKLELHIKAFKDRDYRAIADRFFASDVHWAFEGYPPLHGREAISDFYSQVVTNSAVAIKPVASASTLTTGWTLIDYFVEPHDAAVDPWTYRTIFTWSLRDGEWLVDSAMGIKTPS